MTPFDTAAAIAQASKWTEAAKHLTPLLFAIDKAASGLHAIGDHAARDAATDLESARYLLEGTIEQVRIIMMRDAVPNCPDSDDEAEWSAHEAICAAINAAVISVGALIKKMEMEA